MSVIYNENKDCWLPQIGVYWGGEIGRCVQLTDANGFVQFPLIELSLFITQLQAIAIKARLGELKDGGK